MIRRTPVPMGVAIGTVPGCRTDGESGLCARRMNRFLCATRARPATPTTPCAWCGRPVVLRPRNRRYCNRLCSAAAQRARRQGLP